MVLSIVILWVHLEIDAGHTSFCNVNSTINCDLVLASRFSRILGVPIAWFSLVAYAALGLLYQAAIRAPASTARTALLLACAGSVGAAAFSVYMAFVSFFVVRALCPMCFGLYIASLGLFGTALLAPSYYARAREGTEAAPLSTSILAGMSVLALLGVAGIAAASWVESGDARLTRVTPGEIKAADPSFYSWYLALPVVQVPGSGGHPVGAAAVPVTIVEFSDFECAHCSHNHSMLKDLLAERPDLVRVVYRHFPLDAACNEGLETSVHTRACRAAEAAECAAQQGRFSEMADMLFSNQSRLFESELLSLAERAGLDMEKFRVCMTEHAGRNAILADTRDGNRLRITSTPTLFVNGRKVVGTFEDLRHYLYAVVLESELAGWPQKEG